MKKQQGLLNALTNMLKHTNEVTTMSIGQYKIMKRTKVNAKLKNRVYFPLTAILGG